MSEDIIKIKSILDVPTHLEGIDGVIFDLDDTLYSEKDYVRSGYSKIAEAFPQLPDLFEKLWSAFEGGKPAIDCALEEAGALTEDNKAKAIQTYRFQMPDITLYEGVREMLDRIKAEGKKLGMITDGRPEGQRAKIEALGIAPLFDEIIITDELGGPEKRKPCADAFALMKEKIDIPFERMVYIGDNIAKDFIAPEKLGMRSIYFVNENGLY